MPSKKRPTRFPNAITPAAFVLDVSVAFTWVVRSLLTDYTDAVVMTLGRKTAVVAGSWMTDLAAAVQSAETAGWITPTAADRNLGMLESYPILIDEHAHRVAWADTRTLARTHALDYPGATPLELALRTRLPLATIDARLLAAAPRAGVAVFAP